MPQNLTYKRLRQSLLRFCFSIILLIVLSSDALKTVVATGPTITSISDNRNEYANNQIPLYEKFEITFDVSTIATNPQFPFDSNPPARIAPSIGISVDGEFSPDNWQTIYTQPAFYYQSFDYQIKSGQEWLYPQGYTWKIRFAPTIMGTWQFRIRAVDNLGTSSTLAQSFVVVPSSNHGFVQISRDPRYFEFSDGTYFPGLGYNMNYDLIDWVNPVLNNQSNFQKMSQNGIQLVRLWLSEWSIWGSAWNPWYGIRNSYDGYIPRTGLDVWTDSSPSVGMIISYDVGNSNYYDACRFIGGFQAKAAVKQNTRYHIKVRYIAINVTGPRNPSYPGYGLVAKIQNPDDGNWHSQCYEPGEPQNGVRLSEYGPNTSQWAFLEGQWDSGTRDFLPPFYLAAENLDPGSWIIIDTVEILDPNGFNIVTKPSMEHQNYYMQRNSFAFDKVVDLAHQYGIYLRPVIMEKNEYIENVVGFDGNVAPSSNDYFYGDYKNITTVRWWQQAWWRYLQARWGYSTNIHSWELLNEGDPYNSRHYALADELGKYMHQFKPDNHLVSTSNWHSFPRDEFWANDSYPNIDFADVHQYIPQDANPTHFNDTARSTIDLSLSFGAKQSGGAGKPIIRGETGLTDSGTDPGTSELLADTTAVWLHNFIWGGINPGGLIESYWYSNYDPYGHIYSNTFDHRSEYGNFYQFIRDVHLNNGNYQDINAQITNPNIQIWGQKDLVNGQAHFWAYNQYHTWKNIVDGMSIPSLSGIVSIAGFKPNSSLTIQWWDTNTGTRQKSQSVITTSQGVLTFTINNLTSDIAGKILSAPGSLSFRFFFLPFTKK